MAPVDEPVGISPRIDLAFKRLMADPRHPSILLSFLNAVLAPKVPILSATVENPVLTPDFPGDDYIVVDVLARGADGETYQIEMQATNETAIRERMLYGCAELLQKQLVAGQPYKDLRPVIAVWVLDQNSFRKAPDFHHRFVIADPSHGVQLTEHLEIHTLELEKWRQRPGASLELTGWMRFLTEAEQWAQVPVGLTDPALEEAMDVLRDIKENAAWNAAYRARKDASHRRATAEAAMAQALAERDQERAAKEQERAAKEQERAAKEQERAAKEQAITAKEQAIAREERERAAKEQAIARAEQLRALLRQLGVDPDAS